LKGHLNVPFDALFVDTVSTFGIPVAWKLYRRAGMSRREFRFWCLSCHSRGLI
jgi:hypothetical protein